MCALSVAGYAALYFPWVQAAPAGESLLLPPSGFVAGIYASTDPHVSPVGAIATGGGIYSSATVMRKIIADGTHTDMET